MTDTAPRNPNLNASSPKASRTAQWIKRRDAGRWNVVMGMGLLFVSGTLVNLGGLAVAVLAGAVLTTIYGIATWAFWGWRLHQLDDPWAYDPDLDGPAAVIDVPAYVHPNVDPEAAQPGDDPR